MKITVIGYGNLGSSIVKGLANKREEMGYEITATDAIGDLEKIRECGATALRDNREAVVGADAVFLCVKPWKAQVVIEEIGPLMTERQVLVSPVAGLTIAKILEYFGREMPVFRIMPTIAASINQSTTCVAYKAGDEMVEPIMAMLHSLGSVIPIDESLINAATILSGSGIAFVFRFMRAMVEGGIEIGFRSDVASTIVAQTVKGSVGLFMQEDAHMEQLIDYVCTPSGTTIRGLNEMERHGFSPAVVDGILSAYKVLEKK